jgi:hypothetical protein
VHGEASRLRPPAVRSPVEAAARDLRGAGGEGLATVRDGIGGARGFTTSADDVMSLGLIEVGVRLLVSTNYIVLIDKRSS